MPVLFAFVLILSLGSENCAATYCGETNIALQTDKVYEFSSVGEPSPAPGTTYSCLFEGYAPVGQKISVLCHPGAVMYDRNCSYAKFLYSPSGDTDYADAVTYCGYTQALNFTTLTNRVALKFIHTVPKDVILSGYICYVGTPPPTLIRTTATIRTPTTATSTQTPSVSNCDCGFENPGPRVAGGGIASTAEYPWMVGILKNGKNRLSCGGSLISNQWVLTAAHCMTDETPENVEVVLGTNLVGLNQQSGRRVKVSRVIIHPYYRPRYMKDNDIALLKLADRVTYSNRILPVCLPYNLRHSDYEGTYGTVTGWGSVGELKDLSEVLKDIDLRIMSYEECIVYYRGMGFYKITDNMFCTARPSQGVCKGDSGGPLTVQSKGRHIQLGIVSWGFPPCTDPLNPSVYTKVTNFLRWIENNTHETFCKVN
ncbi:hypothetical protein HAZT_HAZT001596 [Hyalella azteca]|uniref:limulus clotting factor C n=1 Tax=Hyalella azteca TaxID=294128 RepID=A0A6A0H603_HYAAZ|nr:clotting factor G beta subunit [Hyalella azteca]KAA0200990.1 hypothetical protein HAZT_HAZT001596 [Hyalella azteca]